MFEQIQEQMPEIDTQIGLTTCSGDVDFYLELFQNFTQLPIKEELTDYLEKKDYKNYCIRIHGFKNNAYSVGAKALSEMAFEIEQRTKEGLPEDIEELQKNLFSQYDRICRKYKEIRG